MSKVYDYSNRNTEIDTDTCEYCKGNSAIRKQDGSLMTTKEYCEEVQTCAATIDWDKVYSKGDY